MKSKSHAYQQNPAAPHSKPDVKQTYDIPPNIDLRQLMKPISFCAGLVNVSEGDIHELVGVDQVAVVSFACFEFYQLHRRPYDDGGEGSDRDVGAEYEIVHQPLLY